MNRRVVGRRPGPRAARAPGAAGARGPARLARRALAAAAARPRGSPPRRPAPPPASCGQLHRGQRDLHDVELVGERLDDDAEARRGRPSSDRLAQRGARQLEAPGAQVGDGRHLLDRDLLAW